MRALVITQNITLDGSVEMLDDWFDLSGDPDPLALARRQGEDTDARLLGRRTFEDFRGYWPLQTHDTTGITDHLDQVQKYLVSSTMTDPQWQHSTVLTGDPVEHVRLLKDRPGKDIVCTGSITLTHALITAGLVDEYRLFTHPAVQGRGRRLFPDGHVIAQLRLLDARSFGSGVTYTAYQPARGRTQEETS
ncbi:dihydrofolate reductase family protein [Kocuria arenosa]|uniref:dihydrofolate reductase family protein n=1 Tax=Kocuria arenosa TaxID=3071446 RepID=UPI0034D5EC2E